MAVTVAWVYFRAPDIGTANRMLAAMSGMAGFALGSTPAIGPAAAVAFSDQDLLFILSCLLIATVFPNTQQMMARYDPSWEPVSPGLQPRWWQWNVSAPWAVYIGFLAALTCYIAIWSQTTISEFIYYQF